MWAIIKFNKKNFNLMKKELIARNNSLTSFYQPVIKVQKQNKNKLFFKELPLLGNYIFCYNINFSDQNFILSLKNISKNQCHSSCYGRGSYIQRSDILNTST